MQKCTGVKMSRRNLLAGAATIALLNTKSLAQAQPSGPGATALPQHSEVVIRAAFVMTMDPSLGDLKTGDVHIVNGLIRAVGQNVAAPSAKEIDGRDMIALPGFIDTHTHLGPHRCVAASVTRRKRFISRCAIYSATGTVRMTSTMALDLGRQIHLRGHNHRSRLFS